MHTLRGINLLTFDLNPLSLLFRPSLLQGGAGGLLHKREGPDALHQHRRRLLFPAPVHHLHPGHAGLPPQGGGQAAGLLQRGQGGCHRANLGIVKWFCGCGRCRWCAPQTCAVKLGKLVTLHQQNMTLSRKLIQCILLIKIQIDTFKNVNILYFFFNLCTLI